MAATGNKQVVYIGGLLSKDGCGFEHSETLFKVLAVLSFQQHAKAILKGNRSGNREFS